MNNNMGMQMNNNMGMQMNDNMGINRKSITFESSTDGDRKTLIVQYGTSVSDLLKKYFQEIGKPELFKKKESFCFIHNATILNYEDETKIEEKFIGENIKIAVCEKKNVG